MGDASPQPLAAPGARRKNKKKVFEAESPARSSGTLIWSIAVPIIAEFGREISENQRRRGTVAPLRQGVPWWDQGPQVSVVFACFHLSSAGAPPVFGQFQGLVHRT